MLIFELFRYKKKQLRFGFEHFKFFYFQTLVDFLPHGSGSVSVDLHIFAGPDLGSQNVVDPMDLDPRHLPVTSDQAITQ